MLAIELRTKQDKKSPFRELERIGQYFAAAMGSGPKSKSLIEGEKYTIIHKRAT